MAIRTPPSGDTPVIERLAASRLFSGLAPDAQRTLARAARLEERGAGEQIWRAGEPALELTLIQSGLVEIHRAVGSEQSLLGLFGAHEVVGLPAALELKPYPADAVALAPRNLLLRVRMVPVLALAAEEPAFTLALNRALLAHTRALQTKIEISSAGPVPRRLAALMLHLGQRFGDDDDGEGVRIPLSLTRTQLAHLVGARPETVSRVLSDWQRRGWLGLRTGSIELTRVGPLESIAQGGAHPA